MTKNISRGRRCALVTIFFRTLLIYLILITTVRLMGKRQIGELEVTDFVTTLILSEIASLPITDTNIPISHALIPMITLLFLEVASFSHSCISASRWQKASGCPLCSSTQRRNTRLARAGWAVASTERRSFWSAEATFISTSA